MDSRGTLSMLAQGADAVRRSIHLNSMGMLNNGETDFDVDDGKDLSLFSERRPSSYLDTTRILPDNLLVRIFTYLNTLDLMRCTRVCHRWHILISRHAHLWRRLYLRPDASPGFTGAVHVRRLDAFLHAIATRFHAALLYVDLPIELITTEVLRELAIRCPNLEYLTLDFSSAMQLHDFADLHEFPCNLKCLCICLSEVIFLESFMRRIYSYLSSLHILHVIGTLERASLTSMSSPEETDDYETINLSRIKAHAPNLRVVNLYGVCFIDDSHIEALASGCIHMECLALNYCTRFKGFSLKTVFNRCRKLTCLLLQNTDIRDEAILAVNWSNTNLVELDITSTELSENTLLELFDRIPKLNYLAVAYCDGFTDKVLNLLIDRGKLHGCQSLDLSHTVNLNMETVARLLTSSLHVSHRLEALSYTGQDSITEHFWINIIRYFHRIKILVMGTSHSWFRHSSRRIHIDQILEACAVHCPHLERLEIQWDPENLRFSENSSKFIDHLRIRCAHLRSFVLSDGSYYEAAKSNFERAERFGVVRTCTMYHTSIVSNLHYYQDLRFN